MKRFQKIEDALFNENKLSDLHQSKIYGGDLVSTAVSTLKCSTKIIVGTTQHCDTQIDNIRDTRP